MRSELVFSARQKIANRFTLCQAAAKATRLFHVGNTRIQDTTNTVLQRFASPNEKVVRHDNDLVHVRRGPIRDAKRHPREVVA